jgi:eukaryotic-like serine/threonine-protein kinase
MQPPTLPPPSASRDYPQVGDVIEEKYRIEAFLAEGGMGAVVKATHLLRRAAVALKFMTPAVRRLPNADQRFINEAVAASRIDSEHVVKIFDVARLPNGTPYLVMEFVDGPTLGDLLEHEGPTLETVRAVHLTLQILRALHTAHAAGVIHRDMKPSNCFVIDRDGELDFLRVMDFGISKVCVVEEEGEAGSPLTGPNTIFGTPVYMSPEQARTARDVDLRTDLYAAGAILYELLAGRTPYTETGDNILYKIFMTDPDPLRDHCPDLPGPLVDAVHRALQKEPDARFSSAVEMAQALAPFADSRSSRVLEWLLTGRGRSLAPAGSPSVKPPASIASIDPAPPTDEALAVTVPKVGEVALKLAPPSAEHVSAPPGTKPPTTDTGVVSESRGSPRVASTRRVRVAVAIAAVTAALGTGLVAVRRSRVDTVPSTGAFATGASSELRRAPVASSDPSTADETTPPGSLDASMPSAISAVVAPSPPVHSPIPALSNARLAPPPPKPGPVPSSRAQQSGLEEKFP